MHYEPGALQRFDQKRPQFLNRHKQVIGLRCFEETGVSHSPSCTYCRHPSRASGLGILRLVTDMESIARFRTSPLHGQSSASGSGFRFLT